MINVAGVYGRMEPDLLREVRTKNRTGVSAFERKIKAHVEKGIPVLWSVMLGVLPESNVHAEKASGHMRLIIGYGEKSHEILYSDSWGLGHELKRMPVPDAWTITTGLATIEPL